MLLDRRLHLAGVDVETAGLEHLFEPADQLNAAPFVLAPEIARAHEPVGGPGRAARLVEPKIAAHRPFRPELDLPGGAAWHRRAVRPGEPHLAIRYGPADGSAQRSVVKVGSGIADRAARFGQAVGRAETAADISEGTNRG